jgi:hypothetical protein
MSEQFPVSTDEARCCWQCAWSTANPELRETDFAWMWQAKVRPGWALACLRSKGTLVRTFNVCGQFVDRADFRGWPPLPPSHNSTDRRLRGES